MAKTGIMELAARLLSKQHAWAGHVTRLPVHHVASVWCRTATLEDWHLKQAVYSTLDPVNTLAWKHKSTGPKIHWERNLSIAFGDSWRDLAGDRAAWRRSRAHFLSTVADSLLGHNAKLLGVCSGDSGVWETKPPAPPVCLNTCGMENPSFGDLFVERGVAQSALRALHGGMCLQFVGDSELLVNGLLGRSCCKESNLQRPLKLAHTALQTLLQCFHILPPMCDELAKQVPRADNSAADAAANWALDNHSFAEVRVEEVLNFINCLSCSGAQGLALMFSFDGAARGNPGAASYGLCAWWGRFHEGMFSAEGLLIQKGHCLGIGTNNVAEALGLAAAVKTSLRFLFWVTEQLSKLALHPLSTE